MLSTLASTRLPKKIGDFIPLFLILTLFYSGVVFAKVTNIFLVQNSGWMEPFYSDTGSRFKPLILEIIKRVRESSPIDEIVIANFNQSDGANKSPSLLYRGLVDVDIESAIGRMRLATKPSGALADTDFKEALFGAIGEYSNRQPAILWVFTNNKNSPKNSPETAQKNKEFYQWVDSETSIGRIVAFPFKSPVKGKYYQARGVMIYGIAYGSEADVHLQSMVAANRPFGKQPARLKPLNADALTFVPTGSQVGKDYEVGLLADRKTVQIEFSGDSKAHIAQLDGVFRNDFYPYDIKSADIEFGAQFRGERGGIEADIHPEKVANIPAGGQSSPIKIRIAIPPLPSVWEPSVLFGSGHRIPGEMHFKLKEQELTISRAFLDEMGELFPGDPLPDLFVPGVSAKNSTTSRPIIISVNYPTWPLIVVVSGLLVFVVGGLFMLNALLRPKKFKVTVDGVQKTYAMKAFATVSVLNGRGELIGNLKRGLGKPSAVLEANSQGSIHVS